MTIRRKKKAVFFTIDALIGALIILTGVSLISNYHVSDKVVLNLNYLAEDMMIVFNTIRVGELNTTYINGLIASGEITHENNTILEQIGEFWSAEKESLAMNFTKNVTEGLIPVNFGYGIYFDGDRVYGRESPPKNFLVSAKKMMSGLQKKKPLKGYVSSAKATTVVKNTSFIVPFSQEGSGFDDWWWESGSVRIFKQFEMPEYSVIHNATFRIAVHAQQTNNDIMFNFNNGLCVFTRQDITLRLGTVAGDTGHYGYLNVNGCILNGTNNITFTNLENDGYNAHLHPGTLLEIEYELPEVIDYSYSETSKFSTRYYFDDIQSTRDGWYFPRSGAFQLLAFHVPNQATDLRVGVRIVGNSIRDYVQVGNCRSWSGGLYIARCFVDWDGNDRRNENSDFILFINNDQPVIIDGSPAANPAYTLTPAQTAPFLKNGTNTVIAYFNSYGDYSWGDALTRIYSDPMADPDGSSFVEVNYTLPPVSHYGQIEITQSKEFGGIDEVQKKVNFSFPSQAESIGDVFVNIAQQYSNNIRVRSEADTDPPTDTIFNSVAARDVPTKVFIPNSTLAISYLSNNFIDARDNGGNFILRESSVDYTFYVKSFVGYGNVFSTSEEAGTDALLRLNNTLGPFISLQSAEIGSNNVTDVPSMWGPAIIEVRAWH